MSDIGKELLSKLPENVRIAMEMRQANATYKEIGEKLGVTRERARQLIAKGDNLVFKLRQAPRYPGEWAKLDLLIPALENCNRQRHTISEDT